MYRLAIKTQQAISRSNLEYKAIGLESNPYIWMRVAFLFIQIPKAKNESIQTKMGQWISWTCLLLVLLICCDVLLRYVLNTSKTWMVDLEWQLFSLLFLWWAGATWLADKHVQVDLFYSNWSLKRKVLVNNVGTVFLLLPWCAIIIFTSASYA